MLWRIPCFVSRVGCQLAQKAKDESQKGRAKMLNTRMILSSVLLCVLSTCPLPFNSFAMLTPADESIVSAGSESNRLEDLRTLRKVLEHKIVKQRLQDIGLSAEEINTRLDRLSDGQLHLVAMQVNSIVPAGDNGTLWTIVAILLIVILVVLLATLL
jgi:hypothetical protein